ASLRDDGLNANVTYYNRPLLKRPHWDHTVTIYLFLGGIMGGSAILAMVADNKNNNDRRLARNAKYASFVLSAVAPAVLVTHLGRPERFHHMMRVVKLKSPMSLGVWGLIAFSTIAAPNAIAEAARHGLMPRWLSALGPRFLNLPQALLGAFIMGYTGVLISATAIPFWAKGKYHIPAMSVCSGMAGACALHSLLLSRSHAPDTITRLEKLEVLASAAEAAIILDFARYSGEHGKPMFEGETGKKFRKYALLAGIAVPLLLNATSLFKNPAKQRKHSFLKTAIAASLTLLGGYVLRETLIEGGKLSADDPTLASHQPE
ncbi:MAG: NrfD/PsrC family molybdoenzyme membrane anchor subunit, partial [Burkholderiales bacterium]